MACLLTNHFSNDLTGRNRAGKLPGTALRTSGIDSQIQQLSAMVEAMIEVLRLCPWVPPAHLVEENPAAHSGSSASY